MDPEQTAALTRYHEDDAYTDINAVDRCIEDVVTRIMQCASELSLSGHDVIKQANESAIGQQDVDAYARQVITEWFGNDFIKELFHEQYSHAQAVIGAREGAAAALHESQERTH